MYANTWQRLRSLLGLSYVIKSEPGCWHNWGRPVGPNGVTTLADGTPIQLAPVDCGHETRTQ